MIRGIYTAAAGMLATSLANDTLASNLANVNTAGFKANKINYQAFPEMMITRSSDQGQETIGSIMTGSKIKESFVNYAAGPMHATGNTFDMALEGDGFFTVKNKAGNTFYTRAGNFTVDGEGYLTTQNGDYVQGNLGNIQLNLDQGPFIINRQGELSGKGRSIDTLKIAHFADNQMLQKVSDNLYQATPASQLMPPTSKNVAGCQVHQGTLEESNVNPITELVNNIQGMRLYEALQKNIHMHNEALGKAVNDVGRAK